MSTSPKELLQRAVSIMGTQKALANYLGRSPERVSRVMGGGRPDVLGCLRLAELLNEPPTMILRTFDYEGEAEALQRLYEAGTHLRKDERMVLDALAAMPRAHRDRFSALILAYASSSGEARADTPSRKSQQAQEHAPPQTESHDGPRPGSARRQSRSRKSRA